VESSRNVGKGANREDYSPQKLGTDY